jgi:hypothetical protein
LFSKVYLINFRSRFPPDFVIYKQGAAKRKQIGDLPWWMGQMPKKNRVIYFQYLFSSVFELTEKRQKNVMNKNQGKRVFHCLTIFLQKPFLKMR